MFSVVGEEPSPMLSEDGQIYILDAVKFQTVIDPSMAYGVEVTEEGVKLVENTLVGVYVTQPISMPEFSKISLTWQCINTTQEIQPEVFISVYRVGEQEWSDWILLPEGDSAKRYKSESSTVMVRFRINLFRETAEQESMVMTKLFVSGGDHMFTRTNLIMVFIMLSALILYVYRKKQRLKVAQM